MRLSRLPNKFMPVAGPALASFALVLACGGPQGPVVSSFPVTFSAEGDPGVPLPGVMVRANGSEVGISDQDGLVQTMLRGPDGAGVDITYECPTDHVQPSGPSTLRLHRFQSLDPNTQAGLHMRLMCAPTMRTVAFVVRTGKPDLPVLLDNEVVARTNAAGNAHITRATAPNMAFMLKIDTTGNQYLQPQEPYRQYRIGGSDEVFTWDQGFEENRPRMRRRRRRRRRAPIVITRID